MRGFSSMVRNVRNMSTGRANGRSSIHQGLTTFEERITSAPTKAKACVSGFQVAKFKSLGGHQNVGLRALNMSGACFGCGLNSVQSYLAKL